MTTNKNPELSGLIIPVIKIADEGNGDSLIITFLDPVGIGMIFPEDQGGTEAADGADAIDYG